MESLMISGKSFIGINNVPIEMQLASGLVLDITAVQFDLMRIKNAKSHLINVWKISIFVYTILKYF